MRDLIILASAAEDLKLARDFYETIKPELGTFFHDSLMSDLNSLAWAHGSHSVYFGCCRKLATYFPFCIYYIETEMETVVAGILDLRREQGKTRKESSRKSK